MGEGIPMLGVHKKCGRSELVRYGGGDTTVWCRYCNVQIYDYHKEISLGLSWLSLLWYWFKRHLKKGGQK